MIDPDFEAFEREHQKGRAQIVRRRIDGDLETPVSAYLKLAGGKTNAFLLESVEGGETLGRYSAIGLEPDRIWRARDDAVEIWRVPPGFRADLGPPLASFRRFLADAAIEIPADAPPLAAGIFGYLGYETARWMERLPPTKPASIDVPDALFLRPTVVAVFDNVRREITLATPARPEPGVGAEAAYQRAAERLGNIVDRLAAPLARPRDGSPATDRAVKVVSNTTPTDYRRMVARAKEYIAAGDIFQAVLSQRFDTEFAAPPFELYRALRRLNPSPFLFHFDFDGFSVVGSSPEILVRVRSGEITLRPLAGTRARGATAAEDARLAAELLADPKERAEHLMLLDLGRNDVGRASGVGSVKVTESFAIERYSHVMHIVSNVTGRLKNGLDAVDAVCAGFPAGTVSGAPKIRAMEIINEIEAHARGLYAGAVGYFAAGGDVDTCIALRTAIVKDGVMHVQAGAGIVADSDPETEQRECLNKSLALMTAAADALRR